MASVSELIELARFEEEKSPLAAVSRGIRSGMAVRDERRAAQELYDRQIALEGAKQGVLIQTDNAKLKRLAEGVQTKIKSEKARQDLEISEKTTDRLLTLGKEFRASPTFERFSKIQKSADDIGRAYERSLVATDKIAADQAIIVAYNKLIDPDSVVRETEYARTPRGQALLRAIEGRVKAVSEGGAGLTDEARKELKIMADELLEGARQQYAGDVESFGKIVDIVDPVKGRDIVFGGFKDRAIKPVNKADSGLQIFSIKKVSE